jgi:hypothetical protein
MTMSNSSLRRRPFLFGGILIGVLAAGGLLLWMIFNQQRVGSDGEGVAFTAVWLTVVFGFPLDVPLSVLVDFATPAIHSVPRLNVFHVMLLGVVANWVLLGWIADRIRVAIKQKAA